MYLTVKKVEPQDNYVLLLTFENGEKRQFDVKPYLEFGIFKELRDTNVFKSVKPSFDSVEWVNEADIDPETLYSDSIRIE